jgi:DNA adenine methylase
VKWHGGKYYLCREIVKSFPSHQTYLEPFGGGASVLLNKTPSEVEIYNDLDTRITRLFRVLRDFGKEFTKRLALTPYSEAEFEEVHNGQCLEPGDELEQARRDFVRWRMSLGGRGRDFSYSRHRSRRGMADVVSGYLSLIDEQLPTIIERLRSVQILCRPAIQVIQDWDADDALIYCDPPYVHHTRDRRTTDVYGIEMSDEDHRELAKVLQGCKAKIVLSGYKSPLYDELYGGWRQILFDVPNHASGEAIKSRETEVLWLNWDESHSARLFQ